MGKGGGALEVGLKTLQKVTGACETKSKRDVACNADHSNPHARVDDPADTLS